MYTIILTFPQIHVHILKLHFGYSSEFPPCTDLRKRIAQVIGLGQGGAQTISSNLMTPEEINKVGREGVACSGKTAVKKQ